MFKYRHLSLIPFVLLCSGTASAVTSAELYRTEAHTFGKFEARVQFAAGDGVVSSFFLWKDGSELSDVYWNELDFEKLGADCELQTNTIHGLPQENHEGHDYALSGLCDGYHTYAYEWTPEYIAWFVDGTEIRRDTGEHAQAYSENATEGLQFRFNVWPGNANFGGNFSDTILPVYQYVAWAQYSEYTPGAGDNGTDFTLSWREEFDSRPSGWQMGSWVSPLENSTHDSQNVVFVNGIAVLALTADDARGYTGTPPPDGAGGVDVAPTAGAGEVPAPPAEPTVPSTSEPPSPPAGNDDASGDGSGCRLAPSSPQHGGAFGLLVWATLGWFARRRAGWIQNAITHNLVRGVQQ